MAVDAFMWFTGTHGDIAEIVGETADKNIKTNASAPKMPFNVKEYSFDVENLSTLSSATGGAGGGKANFNPLSFSKEVDTASCPLFQACAIGTHIDECNLVMRKAGGNVASLKPYLIFTFKFVFITGVNWSISGDEPIGEAVTFMYGALKIQYWKQKNDGTLISPQITTMWNRVNNTRTDTPVYE
jgi:type VI secretion system secreted protein Hcp